MSNLIVTYWTSKLVLLFVSCNKCCSSFYNDYMRVLILKPITKHNLTFLMQIVNSKNSKPLSDMGHQCWKCDVVLNYNFLLCFWSARICFYTVLVLCLWLNSYSSCSSRSCSVPDAVLILFPFSPFFSYSSCKIHRHDCTL